MHNLIIFSIFFTNKNRGGTLSLPPIITKVYLPLIITKVKLALLINIILVKSLKEHVLECIYQRVFNFHIAPEGFFYKSFDQIPLWNMISFKVHIFISLIEHGLECIFQIFFLLNFFRRFFLQLIWSNFSMKHDIVLSIKYIYSYVFK